MLGCVSIGPRNSQNKGLTEVLTRFRHVCPIRDFQAISHETPKREVEVGEVSHTPECNPCYPKHITHLYTYVMVSPSLWWDPDAPEPLSGENLAPLEKDKAYTTKAGTGVKMGYKSVTSCLVVLV